MLKIPDQQIRINYYTRLMAICPGLPGWAGTRKDFTKAEAVSGSGISWAVCKSAPRCREITTPPPHHSVFTGRMPFLPNNQQRQSTVNDNQAELTVIWQCLLWSGSQRLWQVLRIGKLVLQQTVQLLQCLLSFSLTTYTHKHTHTDLI